MKNLFSALLITTFAVASSVAVQDSPQAGFKAPSLAESSSEETELWNKKHHHHQKTCRNKIITLPFPECAHDCKFKCKAGERECDEGCEAVDHVCGEKCEKYEYKCKDECRDHKGECSKKCTDALPLCGLECGVATAGFCKTIITDVRLIFGIPKPTPDPFIEACETVFLPPGPDCKNDCVAKYASLLPGLAPELAGPIEAGCSLLCSIKDDCTTECGVIKETCEDACETCDRHCDEACEEEKKECGYACDAGKDWCKGKCEHSEHECHEHCKPCTFECERACHEDEEGCFSHCKENQGSDKECRNKCKRDCEHVCKRRCEYCHDDNDGGLAAENAPEEDSTIPTVSAQENPIAPAPVDL